MELWNKIKIKWLYPSCGFFAATILVFMLIGDIAMEGGMPAISFWQVICFLGFSFGMTGASKILYLSFGAITRYLLHASLSLISFIFFILLLTGDIAEHGFGSIAISVVFLFFYAMIMGLRGLFLWLFAEKEKSKKEYDRCFSKNDK